MNRTTAEKIVDAILEDLSDRRGIGNEYEQIDDDVKSELRETWIKVTMKNARK